MKKLINGMLIVLLAVFMLTSNAGASAWDIYGTITGDPGGTMVAIWRVNCGSNWLVGEVFPDENGDFEYQDLGKGEYRITPFNSEIQFDPGSKTINVPQNKPLDFVVVE